MRPIDISRSLPTYLAALCSIALHPSASAGDISSGWASSSVFSWKVEHMPDLDQLRAYGTGILGLPGNGGMYCVPTSTMNTILFTAAHGFPEVLPGVLNWQDDAHYDAASMNLLSLGLYMGTDAIEGTKGDGWYNGTRDWLDPYGKFTVNQDYASGAHSPTHQSMAECAINGSLVIFAFGRYDVLFNFIGSPVVERVGGHIVTLSHIARQGSAKLLKVRDPADPSDGMLWDQSTFGNHEYDVSEHFVHPVENPLLGRSMTGLNYDPASGKMALIDGVIAIRPKAGYSFAPNGPVWCLNLFLPFGLLDAAGPLEIDYPLPSGMTLQDGVLDPDQNNLLFIGKSSEGSTTIQRFNLLSLQTEKLVSLPNARRLGFDRHRKLFVLCDGALVKLDPEQKSPAVQSVALETPGDAIGFADADERVMILSLAAKQLVSYPLDLAGPPHVDPITAPLATKGNAHLAIDPNGKHIAIACEDSAIITALDMLTDGSVKPSGVSLPAVKPQGIDFDDQGHLFVAAQGKVTELKQTSSGWVEVKDPAFKGYVPGAGLHVTRSRTNFDPHTMSGKGWDQLVLDEIPALVGTSYQPDCDGKAADDEYGVGKAGSLGVPHLKSGSAPVLGAATSIVLEKAKPGSVAVLVLGVQPIALPFAGGTLLVDPKLVVPLPAPVGADGTLTLAAELPGDPTLCGVTLCHQFLIPDPGATGLLHMAMSNGLRRTLGSE